MFVKNLHAEFVHIYTHLCTRVFVSIRLQFDKNLKIVVKDVVLKFISDKFIGVSSMKRVKNIWNLKKVWIFWFRILRVKVFKS